MSAPVPEWMNEFGRDALPIFKRITGREWTEDDMGSVEWERALQEQRRAYLRARASSY